MNFVYRKGTKSARKLRTDFLTIYDKLVNRISIVIDKNFATSEMFLNFDQANAKFVPTIKCIFQERGLK